MASDLQIEIEVEQQAQNRILLNEVTPDYNAVTEPNGWGYPPNPTRADIYTADPVNAPAALVNITFPDATSVTINAISATTPLYVIGVDAVYNPFEILPTMAGMGSNDTPFPDGKYSIELQVSGLYGNNLPQDSFQSQATAILYCYSQVECCVNNLYTAAGGGCDGCNNKKLAYAQQADGWLSVLKAAINCGKWAKADEALAILQELCNSNEGGCGGCSGC